MTIKHRLLSVSGGEENLSDLTQVSWTIIVPFDQYTYPIAPVVVVRVASLIYHRQSYDYGSGSLFWFLQFPMAWNVSWMLFYKH